MGYGIFFTQGADHKLCQDIFLMQHGQGNFKEFRQGNEINSYVLIACFFYGMFYMLVEQKNISLL